jgi:hypothetical protein
MALEQQRTEADRLYERYGKPLERDHEGEYVAISPEGETVLGPDLLRVAEEAEGKLGPDHTLFRLGPRVVGKWL